MSGNNLYKRLTEFIEPENILKDEADLACYASDASVYKGAPDVVVKAKNVKQIVEIVKFANHERIPIVPRGAGTSFIGCAVPIQGGIILDFSGMNNMKELDVNSRFVTVEPGVVQTELNGFLMRSGFFFPIDPGSSKVCTIGGMVSCNAGGMRHSVKYGSTRDYVLGLEVVLPTGEVVKTGNKVFSSSLEYDITRLLVGSEGTLAIITEVTLKILPLPEYAATLTAAFEKMEQACDAMMKLLQLGVLPAALEFMDNTSIKMVNEVIGLNLPEVEAILIVDVDGWKECVKREICMVSDVFLKGGAIKINSAEEPKEREELWRGRCCPGRSFATVARRRGLSTISLLDEVTVPIFKFKDLVKYIHLAAKKYGLRTVVYGHAGRGTPHIETAIDLNEKEALDRLWRFTKEICEFAIRADGSVSGEHGAGLGKLPFLKLQCKEALSVMQRIKNLFDPNNILNPGKKPFYKAEMKPLEWLDRIRFPV